MDTLSLLVQGMTKAEVRHFKLFARRGHDHNGRKDLLLYDWMRSGEDSPVKETEWIEEHYGANGKNAFYRLRNRLLEEVNKSLWLQHFEKDPQTLAYYYYSLARLHLNKERVEPALHALKRAEKMANAREMFELLDLIYSFYISLAPDHPFINPERYITLRKENRRKMEAISQFDDLLAMLTYRLRTAQNRGSKDQKLLDLLQETVDEYGNMAEFSKSPKFKIKVFDAVSKILLQELRYEALESYLTKTYLEFSETGVFTKHTHGLKVRMLAYLVNTFFCTQKHEDSLNWAEQLKEALEAFDRQHYESFAFFYYNALVLNYSVLDPQKAIEVLLEMKKTPKLTMNAFNKVFVYSNLAANYYNLGLFSKALRNLIDLFLYDDYINADQGLKFRIEIFELITRFRMEAEDVLDKRLIQVKKDYSNLLKEPGFQKDLDFLNILDMLQNQRKQGKVDPNLHKMITTFEEKYQKTAFQGGSLFAYEVFIKQVMEQSPAR
ncbi:MAG: hypothetical protein AB8F95_20180 [Bacteroidia bacterium]